MDGGALRTTQLDRFTLRAPRRRDTFALIDANDRVVGAVSGDIALRLHAEVVDREGDVMLHSRPPEIYGEDGRSAALLDGFGGVIGVVSQTSVHRFRERWVLANAVSEPIAVIDEVTKLGALISTWDWPMPRRYSVTLPEIDADGDVAPGRSIGKASRSPLGRVWHVAITADPNEQVARRQLLAAFAVIAMDHSV